jgi:hypothetical protein
MLLMLVVLPLLPEIVVLSVSAIANLSGCRVDEPPLDAMIDSQVPPDPSAVARRFVPPSGPVVGPPRRICAIGPLPSVSSIIGSALEAGFLIGVTFGSGVVVVWLALCYVSITLGWVGLLSRLTLAFFVSLLFAVVPYFGPMMSIGYLEKPHCQPDEGGASPCMMYGGDIGGVVHDNFLLGLATVWGAPVALGAFVSYVIILLIGRLIAYIRATRQHDV